MTVSYGLFFLQTFNKQSLAHVYSDGREGIREVIMVKICHDTEEKIQTLLKTFKKHLQTDDFIFVIKGCGEQEGPR